MSIPLALAIHDDTIRGVTHALRRGSLVNIYEDLSDIFELPSEIPGVCSDELSAMFASIRLTVEVAESSGGLMPLLDKLSRFFAMDACYSSDGVTASRAERMVSFVLLRGKQAGTSGKQAGTSGKQAKVSIVEMVNLCELGLAAYRRRLVDLCDTSFPVTVEARKGDQEYQTIVGETHTGYSPVRTEYRFDTVFNQAFPSLRKVPVTITRGDVSLDLVMAGGVLGAILRGTPAKHLGVMRDVDFFLVGYGEFTPELANEMYTEMLTVIHRCVNKWSEANGYPPYAVVRTEYSHTLARRIAPGVRPDAHRTFYRSIQLIHRIYSSVNAVAADIDYASCQVLKTPDGRVMLTVDAVRTFHTGTLLVESDVIHTGSAERLQKQLDGGWAIGLPNCPPRAFSGDWGFIIPKANVVIRRLRVVAENLLLVTTKTRRGYSAKGYGISRAATLFDYNAPAKLAVCYSRGLPVVYGSTTPGTYGGLLVPSIEWLGGRYDEDTRDGPTVPFQVAGYDGVTFPISEDLRMSDEWFYTGTTVL